jgi:hypothetical protein
MRPTKSQAEIRAAGVVRRALVTVLATLAVAVPISARQADSAELQRPIARVQLMPRAPDPLVVRDWPRLARQYYELILNPDTRLDGKRLVVLRTDPPAFDMPSWVGGKPKDEAFTCLSAVIGAQLVGLDPRNLHGVDYWPLYTACGNVGTPAPGVRA